MYSKLHLDRAIAAVLDIPVEQVGAPDKTERGLHYSWVHFTINNENYVIGYDPVHLQIEKLRHGETSQSLFMGSFDELSETYGVIVEEHFSEADLHASIANNQTPQPQAKDNLAQSLLHLTQYSQDNSYVQSQIIALANTMNCPLNLPDTPSLADKLTLTEHNVSFTFELTQLDEREGHSANYYKLTDIKQRLQAEPGAKVILCCHGINNAWQQGNIATITRDEGTSGLWAEFENGEEWNIGFHRTKEPDFLVIASA